MKHLFLFLSLFLGEISVCAQQMISRQLPFFYQLSSNEIFDIYQDREGYLWIGTTNGLARYDGFRLQPFRSDYKNLNLLTNNSISNIVDNGLYVWIGTWKGLNLYDKQTRKIIPFPDTRLLDKGINYMAADKEDNIWIGAGNKIYRCNSTASIVKEYDIFSMQQNKYAINFVYRDKLENIWALTGGGLFRYDAKADSFITYPPLGKSNAPYTMHQDQSGNYWIGTWGEGLWQFFPNKEGEKCYKRHHIINSRSGETEPIFYSMTQDNTFGYLWLLSYNELYALKYTEEGTLEAVDIRDLVDTHMMYTKIMKDREGNLWLGSYDMAYTIFFDNSKIDNYPLPQLKKHMGWDANILNLCLDKNDMMWVNQDRYGLCLYDLSRDIFADNSTDNLSNPGELSIIVKSKFEEGVWISPRYGARVMRMTHQDMKIQIEEDIDLEKQIHNPEGIRDLAEDNKGNLWIFTQSDLYVKRPGNPVLITTHRDFPEISSLTSDREGKIWGVSSDRKVYQLSCVDKNISYELKGCIPVLSRQESVNHICMDREGCLWLVSSLGRIFKSDADKEEFESMSLDNRIDDCSVLGLLADENNVWIITNKKVLQYDIYQKTCMNYATSDGNIWVDVFRYRAISQDKQGGLYVGGHRGFIHIQSGSTSSADKIQFSPAVTDVKVENKSVFFAEDTTPHTVNRISLAPNSRNIEIFFSSLIYSLNSKVEMAYKLDGTDKDWVYLPHDKSSAFYNQLKKGTYSFRLKWKYEQGKWTEGKVVLTIAQAPAFYETWAAYTVYIVLTVLGVYLSFHTYARRIKIKNEVKLKEELARTKLNYFTNISHELLTPLTVISCVTDHLEQKVPAIRQQSAILKSNTDKLKRLIQQILDFRKMDVGKMNLNVCEGNISEFILNICKTNFLPLAQKKGITLETDVEPSEIKGYLDFDKLDKIVYNLLSNAIKYTPENKSIKVDVYLINKEGSKLLSIKVKDEGIGISPKEINHIFTRFYSSKKQMGVESNGIGLSLTKDLVNLHHGTITVDSTLGKGTCFTVELPIDRARYESDEIADETEGVARDADEYVMVAEDDVSSDGDTDKSALLLIDDNTELLYIMKEMFKEKYSVWTAADGQQAWDKLNSHEVDMIICDVMLPDTNGWELCTRIKSDLRFNHIPVVILTAKNGIDDRIASYDAGADGYIAKPFERKVLFARVDNLIKSFKMRRAAFRKEENVNLETLAYPSADKQFLQSIIESIEQHLEESEFDLEILSGEMNMSKSTLYRKIKSMTGLTPLDFVRNIKMKRACMMLLARTQTISEVAYAVGFSNPKYFTKCFKEEFGVTPTEYQQSHIKM